MTIAPDKLRDALRQVRQRLIHAAGPDGHWLGRLSSSALSTATASLALHRSGEASAAALVSAGRAWLIANQNADGSYGDTPESPGNLATTALVEASLFATASAGPDGAEALAGARRWLTDRTGGTDTPTLARALSKRYGRDKTFSVPILAFRAVATGRADDWRHVAQLPMELGILPHAVLRFVRLPVVSYALPALIAVGLARHRARPSRNPIGRAVRKGLEEPCLRKLVAIQPDSGGFLEAIPLTSFVLLCLLDAGRGDCPAVQPAGRFLRATAREDGSWPIDTNLATWTTTLSVQALAAGGLETHPTLPPAQRASILGWLLAQQHRRIHPYTQADPGGWAWTDTSGGVPDADDSAGALLTLAHLAGAPVDTRAPQVSPEPGDAPDRLRHEPALSAREPGDGEPPDLAAPADSPEPAESPGLADLSDNTIAAAAAQGCRWLLGVTNADGGVATFCRGWGALPFDRSAADLTAHALAAWRAWAGRLDARARGRLEPACRDAQAFLAHNQREDGSWLALWFGSQQTADETNPVYGTARVLSVLADLEAPLHPGWASMVTRSAEFLLRAQGPEGAWGAEAGVLPTVEETAVAVDALARTACRCGDPQLPICPERVESAALAGAAWLVGRVGAGNLSPAPIGLYFARLWYDERLYPLIFTTQALGSAYRLMAGQVGLSGPPAADRMD